MSEHDYTKTITVDRTPAEVFAAVTDVRGWWSAEVVGATERRGDQFVFEVPGAHYSKIELTEVVPGKKVVWHVQEARIEFVADKDEWTGTDIVFDITERDGATELRFTHVGLVPADECYETCSDAWGFYLNGSLRSLITTGTGRPHRATDTFESEVRKHQAVTIPAAG